LCRSRWPVPARLRAPTRQIPEIALAPDIRDVCRLEGTLLMS
jgi:hypothetical protein